MKKENQEKNLIILAILLFVALLYFFVNIFNLLNIKQVQAVSAVYDEDEILNVFENENPIDIDKIISENRNIKIKEEMDYEQLDLEYNTQYINNSELPSGTIHVSQIGINGIQDVITIKKYNGEELISEKVVANNVRKASVNKIVEIGTGKRKK